MGEYFLPFVFFFVYSVENMQKLLLLVAFLAVAFSYSLRYDLLTEQEKSYIEASSRQDINGWIYLNLTGSPYAVGFAHGSYVAAEYSEAVNVFKFFTYHNYGVTYDFFTQQAVQMHKAMIYPDLLQELQGIADGITKQGYTATLDDIIGWNAYQEISGYWWPTARSSYANNTINWGHFSKSHCSAFLATGDATTDGKIVIGHESFTEFWNGQYFNLIADITPTSGYRVMWQGAPGWVGSGTDFWLNSAGLVVVETTIVGYQGYDPKGTPEWIRVRNATQYASSMDGWVNTMLNGNNGGYANMWLIGDLNTNEIGSLELGLIYQNYTKKSNGYFFGENAPNDARIRNLECTDVGFNDVRQQTGARRTRWPQLLTKNYGKIDPTVGQTMLGDTFDVYLGKENPSSRCICSHYDVDPQYYASDPNAVWNVPFYPAGSVDGKVTSASLARDMKMWGIFGRADGVAFDAESFCTEHPQWNWQAPYLKSRPSQPWTLLG